MVRIVLGVSASRQVQACPLCGVATPPISGPWLEEATTGKPICKDCARHAPLVLVQALMLFWQDRDRRNAEATAALAGDPHTPRAG